MKAVSISKTNKECTHMGIDVGQGAVLVQQHVSNHIVDLGLIWYVDLPHDEEYEQEEEHGVPCEIHVSIHDSRPVQSLCQCKPL